MGGPNSVVQFPGAPFAPNLDNLLRAAPEDRSFARRPLGVDLLEELHALMAVGPGMTGASPTRLLFVTTPAAKSRLARHLAPRDREAARLAPACAVIAYDHCFAEQMLAFASDGVGGESCFDEPPRLRAAALRNSVLQGGYLALSARALRLETIFFKGFDAAGVTAEFFREPDLKAIFVAAIGYPQAA